MNIELVIALVTQAVLLVGIVGAWMQSRAARADVQKVHLIINSRFDELLKTREAAAEAKGRKDEKQDQKEREEGSKE